jgi:glycosyltransferase involved in cell wall biosynthesis
VTDPVWRLARWAYHAAQAGQGRLWTTGRRPYSRLYYVIEPADWAIAEDGHSVTRGLSRAGLPARVARSGRGLRRQIVHYGSRNLYMLDGYREAHPSNRVVMTWYHGHPDDPNPENQAMIAALPARAARLCAVATASTIARDRLIGWGVPPEKIGLLPIGTDLGLFRPRSFELRAELRRRLGIQPAQACLGLFHKDGEGWGEGLTPKWVKAPDVFLSAVERLRDRYPLFVLLTGPARGYVIRGLQRLGVSYRHLRLKRLREVAPLYQALDLYMIPSREEGGPKALLECMASGVPLVSTRVGMCADVIRDGENGLLAEVDDAEGLARAAARLIESPELGRSLARAGLAEAQKYDWSRLSQQYLERLYRPLLAAP